MDENARLLFDAIVGKAINDYIRSAKYIKKHEKSDPRYATEKQENRICEWFLGDSLCRKIDRYLGNERN